VNIILNPLARKLSEENICHLIDNFISDNLCSVSREKFYYNLSLKIGVVTGKLSDSAGKCVAKDGRFGLFHISLSLRGMKRFECEIKRLVYELSPEDFKLLILFHEVAHVIWMLNYHEIYEPFVMSKEAVVEEPFHPDEENWCNQQAERFLMKLNILKPAEERLPL